MSLEMGDTGSKTMMPGSVSSWPCGYAGRASHFNFRCRSLPGISSDLDGVRPCYARLLPRTWERHRRIRMATCAPLLESPADHSEQANSP